MSDAKFVRLGLLVALAAVVPALTLAAPDDPATGLGASRLLSGTPDVFMDACKSAIAEATKEVGRLKEMATPRVTLEALAAYDKASEQLGNAAARAGLARNVHPSDAMRTTAEQCDRMVDAALTGLSLDRGVYDALAGLNLSGVDPATRFYVEKTLRDFRRAGVDRDDTTRARIRTLRDELVGLGQEFGNNIKDDVRQIEIDPGDLEGLPDDYRRAHPAGADGKVVITTDNTDYIPFMTYAKSEKAREALWKIYRLRGHPKNLDVLGRMLATREELAKLLGFDTWADYITGDKMIGSRQNAVEFIERIAVAAEKRMQSDYAEILARKKKDDPAATSVNAWDASYLDEKVKVEKYGFDSQSVRPYFEYGRVRQGLMEITSRLFGITYRPVTGAAVWHEDVEVFDVFEGEKRLGRIYLDMYPRENKYKHYAQFTLTNGKAGAALPEGVLVCNFPRPGSDPALMEHVDVETFFHEWGHLLHHVLGGQTRWAGISGVATEWDFVEAPSQMLEEWVRDAPTLQTFARHYKTNEPIPTALVERLRAADEFGKGLTVRQQMFYAALSLELHSRHPKGLDTTKVVAELQERYTPYRFVDGTYFHESFGHLDGYSAIYYTYMWSLVIAKDLFTVFEREGLLNPDAASRYRKAILEPGGSKPAAELVKEFLKRSYDFKAYEEWLNSK